MQSRLLVSALFSVASVSAMAQSKFEGVYGQVGIGYENVAPSLSSSGVSVGGVAYPYGISAGNANSVTGTATLGYTFAINKDFLLGIGGEYSPVASNSQQVTNTFASNLSGSYNKQNAYNVFISPSFSVSTDGLAYAKVGFTGAQFQSTALVDSATKNFTGYSLGLGYKQFISGGLYAFGEINYASYGNQSATQNFAAPSGPNAGKPVSLSMSSSFNVTNLLIGVGYRF